MITMKGSPEQESGQDSNEGMSGTHDETLSNCLRGSPEVSKGIQDQQEGRSVVVSRLRTAGKAYATTSGKHLVNGPVMKLSFLSTLFCLCSPPHIMVRCLLMKADNFWSTRNFDVQSATLAHGNCSRKHSCKAVNEPLECMGCNYHSIGIIGMTIGQFA